MSREVNEATNADEERLIKELVNLREQDSLPVPSAQASQEELEKVIFTYRAHGYRADNPLASGPADPNNYTSQDNFVARIRHDHWVAHFLNDLPRIAAMLRATEGSSISHDLLHSQPEFERLKTLATVIAKTRRGQGLEQLTPDGITFYTGLGIIRNAFDGRSFVSVSAKNGQDDIRLYQLAGADVKPEDVNLNDIMRSYATKNARYGLALLTGQKEDRRGETNPHITSLQAVNALMSAIDNCANGGLSDEQKTVFLTQGLTTACAEALFERLAYRGNGDGPLPAVIKHLATTHPALLQATLKRMDEMAGVKTGSHRENPIAVVLGTAEYEALKIKLSGEADDPAPPNRAHLTGPGNERATPKRSNG